MGGVLRQRFAPIKEPSKTSGDRAALRAPLFVSGRGTSRKIRPPVRRVEQGTMASKPTSIETSSPWHDTVIKYHYFIRRRSGKAPREQPGDQYGNNLNLPSRCRYSWVRGAVVDHGVEERQAGADNEWQEASARFRSVLRPPVHPAPT
jgi:hypothetical protein